MKNAFAQYKRNVTSQWGEDGIIEEIFNRIGVTNKYCVEFGAGNGTELSNVWNLISNKKWNAILIEPNPVSIAKWEELAKPYGKAITLVKAFITLEKGQRLDDVLLKNGAPKDLDLLSIDIDSNDYHIFKSLEQLKPRLILLEHNPTIAPPLSIFQQYNEEPSFGSSFVANVELAHKKGYKLVTATVTNGFYIRDDEFSKLNIEEPKPGEVFDDYAVTQIISAYNGTLYMKSKQGETSYVTLFNSSNFAPTGKSIHSVVVGVGYNQKVFSPSLSEITKPVKILLDGKNRTTGFFGFISNLAKLFTKK